MTTGICSACNDFVDDRSDGEDGDDLLCDPCAQQVVQKLRATLARVEALPEYWRSIVADADRLQLHVSPLSYEVAADELEAALRGDP